MGGRGAVSSSGRGINATSIGSWLQGRGDDGEKFNEENSMNSTIGLITSQNATAPKPEKPKDDEKPSLITSQNATAPKLAITSPL